MHLFGFQAKIKQTCSLPFVFSPVHVASPLGCSTEWSLLFCVLPQHWWLLTIIAGLTWLFSHLCFPLTPWKLTPALLHIAEQALRRKCVVKGGAERAPACRGKARESKTGAHVPLFFFFLSFLFIVRSLSFFLLSTPVEVWRIMLFYPSSFSQAKLCQKQWESVGNYLTSMFYLLCLLPPVLLPNSHILYQVLLLGWWVVCLLAGHAKKGEGWGNMFVRAQMGNPQ